MTDAFAISRRTSARKDISAHAVIAHLPAEFTVRTVVSQSQLELPNGVVLRKEHGRASALYIGDVAGSISGWAASVEAALGASLLGGNGAAERARSEQWPVVLEVEEDTFARYRSEAGRLTAEIAVLLERAMVSGRLPLADRATLALGDTRVSIAGVIRRATGCTVLVRRAFVESLFTPPRYTQMIYVLRNPQRGEAVTGDFRPLYQDGFSAAQWVMQPPHVGGRGLVVEQYELLFPPNREPDTSIVDLDASWVAGAELVMLEQISAGRISRTVTVDGFRMAP